MAPLAAQADRKGAPASLEGALLVSLVALGLPAAQLVLRALDDNRLTSWRWVFAEAEPLRLFALLAAAVLVANVAARAPWPPPRAGALLFAAAFAAAACFWRAPEVVVDASRYFTQAKHLARYGPGAFAAGWGREFQAWTDLPLVPAIDGAVLAIFGEARAPLQATSTLLFAGTVVVTWRLGRALWGEEAGFLGAALLLASPYLLVQAGALLVDVPTMFFLALATYAAVEAARRGGTARLALAAAGALLALLSKYSAWLLLTGLPAAALAAPAGERRPAARRIAAVVLAAGALLALALLPWRDVVLRQLALLAGYQAPGLRRWGESYLSTFLFQVHPFVAAAAIASAGLALRRRDARWLAVAWPVLVLLALDVRRIRYWVPAFPMLALLAARGLELLPPPLRRLAVACAVAWSLVVGLAGQLPFLARTSAANLADAGAFLDALPEPAVRVFAAGRPGAAVNPAVSVPLLDLSTQKPLRFDYPAPPPRTSPEAARSPLRFTWEYVNPRYYAEDAGAGGREAVALVSDDLEAPLPPDVAARVAGLDLARVFAADEGVFEHRTFVRVYRERPGAGAPAASGALPAARGAGGP